LNSCTLGTSVATQSFIPVSGQGEWKTVKLITTEAQPIHRANSTGEWAQSVLADSLHFSSGLQVKLAMQSNGVNGIFLLASPLGDPWWKGHKRLEILYESGVLNVLLRDGSQEAPASLSQVQLEAGDSEVTVIFDQGAKNIEIYHGNKIVMQLSTQTVGDFPDGLFPDGWIVEVDLANGPNSDCTVNKLEFLVPVSDVSSPTP
jgi:hypothetical protein